MLKLKLGVLLAAPNAGVLVAAPNAGVLQAPKAGAEPNEKPLLLDAAPKAGVLLAPNAGVLVAAPKEKAMITI